MGLFNTFGLWDHDDHDIHGLVIEIRPDGSMLVDEDCDCSPDCPECERQGVAR